MTTANQRSVLGFIKRKPQTIRQLENPQWSYNKLHGILRRLENHGLVRRMYKKDQPVTYWELTEQGRKELTT